MRLSQRGLENIRRGLKRSWSEGGTHRERFKRGELDADTLRRRALFDRKGTHYATIAMNGQTYSVLWSTLGRSDQVDIYHNTKKLVTCRPSLVLRRLEELNA